jgi:NAD(P)-dependent dehydrogenase (short-subunit alcohol dehydrogenase family)
VADLPLVGKAALVTGAAVRVGRSIALALAGEGADVAIHYGRSASEAAATASEVRGLGRRAEIFAADLADADQCRGLVRSVLSAFGRLDVVVHSASNFYRMPLEDTGEQIWDSAMDVNARAGFLIVREAAPSLRQRGGRVVLISDLMALHPPRHYLAHSVSKAAVEGLVRALAIELAPEVSVNGVAPGAVLFPEGTTSEQAARWTAGIPLGRHGSPEDVARTVVFLCSASAFITGQIIRVDGGESVA